MYLNNLRNLQLQLDLFYIDVKLDKFLQCHGQLLTKVMYYICINFNEI